MKVAASDTRGRPIGPCGRRDVRVCRSDRTRSSYFRCLAPRLDTRCRAFLTARTTVLHPDILARLLPALAPSRALICRDWRAWPSARPSRDFAPCSAAQLAAARGVRPAQAPAHSSLSVLARLGCARGRPVKPVLCRSSGQYAFCSVPPAPAPSAAVAAAARAVRARLSCAGACAALSRPLAAGERVHHSTNAVVPALELQSLLCARACMARDVLWSPAACSASAFAKQKKNRKAG